MARKKHGAEQIVALLRQIEVELANHKNIGQACKEARITQQTYYRWHKEYGGLKLEQARRLKALEKENGRLRRLPWNGLTYCDMCQHFERDLKRQDIIEGDDRTNLKFCNCDYCVTRRGGQRL